MKKKILIVIAVLAIILTSGSLYFFVYENPLRGTLYNKSYEEMPVDETTFSLLEAKEDIDYLYNLIKTRHYSAKDGSVTDEVETAYNDVISNLKESNSLSEIWQSIAYILNKLDDGHARVGYIFNESPKLYDVKFEVESKDEWYVYIEDSRYVLISLYGYSVNDIYDFALENFSYENIYYLHYLLETRLVYPIYEMFFTGDIDLTGSIEYLDENQVLISDVMNKETISSDYPESIAYSFDLENSVALLEINQMINDSVNKEKLNDFFTQVKENQIDSVIIDIKNNGGGNSLIIKELFTYFPVNEYSDYGTNIRYRLFDLSFKPQVVKNNIKTDLVFNGDLYLITSARTFSSAAMLTAIFRDNNLGLIYGEPIGNSPSMFGDILQYQMPNSKLPVTLTYKFFTRPNGDLTEDTILPDVIINSNDAYQRILSDILSSE